MNARRDSVSLAVTIDGPAGAGKTTTARRVAERLGYRHVDTGAMYRAVTWKALQSAEDLGNGARMGEIAEAIDLVFVDDDGAPEKVLVDGTDVTRAIRSADVTANVSMVSAHPAVRRAMVRHQRRSAAGGNVVLEGRDIGSVVLPHAEVKIYLDASVEERARRRLVDAGADSAGMSLDEIRADIERRDRFDSSREMSPLRVPVGARIVDTTGLTIDEQVQDVVDTVERVRAAITAVRISGGGDHPAERERPFYRFVRLSALVVARVGFGLRVVRSDGGAYHETVIYAANHRSNADPPVVASALAREIAFMAKESLFRVPLLGPLIRKLNSIPTARERFDRKAIRNALDWLENGGSLLIFPEGRRSRTRELGEALPGVGYLALKSGRPVVPVFLSGSESLWDTFLRRGGKRLTLTFGRPIRLTDPATARPNTENCRDYAQMVMCAIQALQEAIE